MAKTMKALALALPAAAALAVTACGSHPAGAQAGGSHPVAASHSQIAKALVSDCEAEVKSLARGSGAATPASYKSTVDHFAAEMTALAGSDGNPLEAAALRKGAEDLTRYAADIGALPDAEYLHSTTYLTTQPIKGDLAQTIRDSQTLKQRYGLVCIPAG